MKTSLFQKVLMTMFFIATGSVAYAQQTVDGDGDINKQASEATLGTVGTGAADGGYVRVIDNKGTIKFLQVQNGITQITDTTPDGGIVTTWQLGGTITADTSFSAGTNDVVFNFTAPVADDPATPSVDESVDGGTFQLSGLEVLSDPTTAGLTALVKDGDIVKEIALGDLLQVQSGQQIFTATANDEDTFTMTNGTLPLPLVQTVWVYRNGAKLLAGTDYTVSGNDVTLTLANHPVYANDVIEVQFVK